MAQPQETCWAQTHFLNKRAMSNPSLQPRRQYNPSLRKMTFRSQLGGKACKTTHLCAWKAVWHFKKKLHFTLLIIIITQEWRTAILTARCSWFLFVPCTDHVGPGSYFYSAKNHDTSCFPITARIRGSAASHQARCQSLCQRVQGWESHQSQQGAQFIRAQQDGRAAYYSSRHICRYLYTWYSVILNIS